jgi:hypothetical protein
MIEYSPAVSNKYNLLHNGSMEVAGAEGNLPADMMKMEISQKQRLVEIILIRMNMTRITD